MTVRARSLCLIVLAQVLALSLWFSATAVGPALRVAADIDAATVAYFTSAVQAGFVCGTLLFAIFGVADRFDGRFVFCFCAIIGALANIAIVGVGLASDAVIPLRFLTGAALAGVYPVGMKLAAGWAKGDVGLLVGLLVGALTVGSASPHLFVFAGDLDWTLALSAASASAAVAALAILFAKEGPATRRAAGFRARDILAYWTDKPVRYANFGYLGHMWELYAMWAWIGVFLAAAFEAHMNAPDAARYAALGTFAIVAMGAPGAVLAGWAADRIGRTAVTSLSLAVSGACALTIGFLFDAHPAALLAVALLWGFAIVADSAQFSASVAELARPDRVGAMLTLQTSVGFALTLLTIHAMPALADLLGWRYAFAPLAIGPALGILAMQRLRRMPEATKLAGGRR